jgi:hypothetical protein
MTKYGMVCRNMTGVEHSPFAGHLEVAGPRHAWANNPDFACFYHV